jgi:hypothetical protein
VTTIEEVIKQLEELETLQTRIRAHVYRLKWDDFNAHEAGNAAMAAVVAIHDALDRAYAQKMRRDRTPERGASRE